MNVKKKFFHPSLYFTVSFVGATHHDLCNRSTQLGNLKPARLMFLWLNTTDDIVNVFSVSALTLTSSAEVKYNFYSQLDSAIQRIPKKERINIIDALKQLHCYGWLRSGSRVTHMSWPLRSQKDR